MATRVVPGIRPISPFASLEDMRAAVAELQEIIQTREPLEAGDPLNKYLTLSKAVQAGLVIYTGPGGGGSGGGIVPPPPPPPGGWDDLTPPDPLTGLLVTSIPTGFFIEFDAPTYSQGGGNAYSIIYGANYVSGPLPTFGDAVELGRCTERSPILILAAEPGTTTHFWAQPVSRAEDYQGIAPQTPATGGTNGVSATAGQLSDDHLASLSVGKLLAGELAVGEHIRSTGFVSGSFGYELQGDGDSEFNNVVVRGTIYATAGLIGDIEIYGNYIQSAGYNGTTAGFRLDGALGKIFAYEGEFGGDLKANSGTLGDLEIEGSIFAGKTSYADTTAGFWLGMDSGVAKLHIGDADWWLKWTGTSLEMRSKSALGFAVGESLFYREISHAEAGTSTDGDASVRFNTDGTVEWREGAASAWNSVGNWFLPTTANIGNSYSIRVAPEGSALDAGAANTRKLVALSSARTFTITAPWTSGANSKTTALYCEFFANGGTQALGAGTIDLFAEYAP